MVVIRGGGRNAMSALIRSVARINAVNVRTVKRFTYIVHTCICTLHTCTYTRAVFYACILTVTIYLSVSFICTYISKYLPISTPLQTVVKATYCIFPSFNLVPDISYRETTKVYVILFFVFSNFP